MTKLWAGAWRLPAASGNFKRDRNEASQALQREFRSRGSQDDGKLMILSKRIDKGWPFRSKRIDKGWPFRSYRVTATEKGKHSNSNCCFCTKLNCLRLYEGKGRFWAPRLGTGKLTDLAWPLLVPDSRPCAGGRPPHYVPPPLAITDGASALQRKCRQSGDLVVGPGVEEKSAQR